MKNNEECRKELDAPIPRSAVSTRSQGRFDLSYLEGWYVIDRLNKIFGQGNWGYSVLKTELVHAGQVANKHFAAYTALVQLNFRLPDDAANNVSDVGYGDGYDGTNPGKPHESALKEAVTDALKRCAKSLGMSLGLALYDKQQENVVEEAVVVPAPQPQKEVKQEVKLAPKVTAKDELKALAINLISRGKLSKEQFKEQYLQKVGVAKVDDIKTDDEVKRVTNELRSNFKEENGNGK